MPSQPETPDRLAVVAIADDSGPVREPICPAAAESLHRWPRTALTHNDAAVLHRVFAGAGRRVLAVDSGIRRHGVPRLWFRKGFRIVSDSFRRDLRDGE